MTTERLKAMIATAENAVKELDTLANELKGFVDNPFVDRPAAEIIAAIETTNQALHQAQAAHAHLDRLDGRVHGLAHRADLPEHLERPAIHPNSYTGQDIAS